MSNLLEQAKRMNKVYESDSFLRKSDIIPQYKRLKSRAFGMSYPLYGGLPYGRICVYSGKQHSGKTTAAFAMIADYQRENPDKMCLFVDVEHSLDLQFQCLMNGVNQDLLYVMDPEVGMSGEQILGAILELQLNSDDIGMIVVDSAAALDTAQNLKTEFEKDNGKRGTIATAMHKFCKEMLGSLSRKQNILIFINQVRVKGETFTGAPIYSEPSGDALKFYSSVSVRFGTRKFMKDDKEITGENSGEGADGFKILFNITKNKTAATSRGGGFITYRYLTGMDWLFDLFEIACAFDYIQKNGSYYTLINLDTNEPYKDELGKDLKRYKKDLITYIEAHENFKNEYIDMLQRHISASNTQSTNLLDADSQNEITMEESTVVSE